MSDEATEKRVSFTIERSGETTLVHCRGDLVAGVTELFYGEVRPLIPGAKQIILDLHELHYLDSSGLGAILRVYVAARSAGCDLQLSNIGPRVRQLLGITNLISVLKVIGESNIRF